MTTIDLGSVTVDNSQILNFSTDEIKASVKKFLEEEFLKREPKMTKQGKWARVADEIRGTMSQSTSDYLQECSKEIREGFELRDLPLKQNS
ncbi:MAG: hypothetical protein U9N49_07220 [Campylobacterota bacterium]|nr:hypothetical protein [Campylobacterota bacterium]